MYVHAVAVHRKKIKPLIMYKVHILLGAHIYSTHVLSQVRRARTRAGRHCSVF